MQTEMAITLSRVLDEVLLVKQEVENSQTRCIATSYVTSESSPQPLDFQTLGTVREKAPRKAILKRTSDALFQILGFSGMLSLQWNEKYMTYFFSMRSRLPLSSRLGERSFVADIALRQSRLSWTSFSLLSGGGIGLRNVVPDDSEIMSACESGNIFKVRDLFNRKLASPYDVTVENCAPLAASSKYFPNVPRYTNQP